MVRRYIAAISVLGFFILVSATSAQAWSGNSESAPPGESMSSEPTTPGAEDMTGEFKGEEPVETGSLPQSSMVDHVIIFGDDVERQLQEGIVPGGGP